MKLNQIMVHTPSEECESVATGFQRLDHLTGGLRIGQLCTVAARPGVGKTAFSVSLLRNIGVVQKVPTAYFSLELSELEIMNRLKASLTGSWEAVPKPSVEMMNTMKTIGFHYQDVDQAAIQSIEEAPVWIGHNSGVGVDEIVSRMEQLRQENQVRVVIIDSIGLLMCDRNHIEQTQAIEKLYQAADRLKQAVIVTSEENSSQEVKDGCKRPRLSDLCEWGRIGSFSSMVMFVYRPECYYFEISEDDGCSYVFEMSENGTTSLYKICDTFEDGTTAIDMADIMVEKNSFGGTGNVRMHFDNHVSFRELSTIKNKTIIIMEHKELVAIVAKAWASLDAKMIEPFLSKDFEYESFWVFETMKGKTNYMDYLTGKFQAIRQSGNAVAVKTLFQARIDQDVVVLGQGDSEAALQIWTEEGMITKMWMRPIDLLPG